MKSYKQFMSEDAPGSKVGNSISINQHGGSDPYDIQNDDVLIDCCDTNTPLHNSNELHSWKELFENIHPPTYM